jgi:Cd2+/Zn2+-exporting ATPase
MAKLGLALCGGLFILNSYLLSWLLPEQAFAADAAAVLGAAILATPIFLTALRDLAVGRIHMNELVAIAILAAMAGADFRTAGIIAFFLLITIIIEAGTASGAQRSIEALIRLAPTTARKLGEDGGESMVEATVLVVGDTIRIRPGENFPVDGVILRGNSTVNQASITGESLPVDKAMNDDVFAGTQNLTGTIDVRVTKVGEDTTLGQVKELILAAEGSKPPIVRMIDFYAGYYTPAILVIAGVTWWLTGNMRSVIAVLVASCPCALVLATPSAIVAALAAASRLGILIKNVADLELAARIRAFVFDKTGTLTGGVLKVGRLAPAPGVEPAELLRVAAATESQSNHPVALALQQLAAEAGLRPPAIEQSREIHGKGMEANVAGALCRVGRKAWLVEQGCSCDGLEDPEADVGHAAMSVVHVARDGQALGWIGFQDSVREGAVEAVRLLKELGVRRCAMFTGDRASVADLVARQVGIEEVRAECLPDGKVAYVEELKRDATVAVVGDGVNDAPALAAGDLGIAMGAIGSDIAINSASIALMTNDLRRLPLLIVLARRSRLVMYQNLALGMLFIVLGIGFSVFGYLPPVAAAILHTLSTLVVIFNSARLVRTGEEFTLGASPAAAE